MRMNTVLVALAGLALACAPSGEGGGSDTDSGGEGSGDPGGEGPSWEDDVEEVPGSGGSGRDWTSDDLFSDDELPTFELELSDDAIDSLKDEPYEWVEGTLIFDGERYEPVAIRTKGENSWQPIGRKPSLKVKLDHYDDGPHDIFGLEELTFQNMDNDYSMMHERVAYRLYREAGVPASRATHMWLVLNGEDYGLYTHLETVDRDMMKAWREVEGGRMFEQWDVDFYDTYIPYFQLEFGDEDRTNLQGVADALEGDGEADDKIALAEAHIDYDSFLRYWAVGAVVGQFDAYPYSSPGDDCHVYDNPESGVLEYVPHGMDEAFYYPTHNVQTNAGGILAYTCRQSSDCRARWHQHVADVLDIADAIDQVGYHDLVADQIEDLVTDDDNKPYKNSEVSYYQGAMRSFIVGRRDAMQEQIGVGGE